MSPQHGEVREHVRPFAVKREILLEGPALVLEDGLALPRLARSGPPRARREVLGALGGPRESARSTAASGRPRVRDPRARVPTSRQTLRGSSLRPIPGSPFVSSTPCGGGCGLRARSGRTIRLSGAPARSPRPRSTRERTARRGRPRRPTRPSAREARSSRRSRRRARGRGARTTRRRERPERRLRCGRPRPPPRRRGRRSSPSGSREAGSARATAGTRRGARNPPPTGSRSRRAAHRTGECRRDLSSRAVTIARRATFAREGQSSYDGRHERIEDEPPVISQECSSNRCFARMGRTGSRFACPLV